MGGLQAELEKEVVVVFASNHQRGSMVGKRSQVQRVQRYFHVIAFVVVESLEDSLIEIVRLVVQELAKLEKVVEVVEVGN